jgi:hypothetical protein
MIKLKKDMVSLVGVKALAAKMHVTEEAVYGWETKGLSDKSIKRALEVVNGIKQLNNETELDTNDPSLYSELSKYYTGTDVDIMNEYFEVVKEVKDGTHSYMLVHDKTKRKGYDYIRVYDNGTILRDSSGKNACNSSVDRDGIHWIYCIGSLYKYIMKHRLVCWAFGKLNSENKLMTVHHKIRGYGDDIDNFEICTREQHSKYTMMEMKMDEYIKLHKNDSIESVTRKNADELVNIKDTEGINKYSFARVDNITKKPEAKYIWQK